MLNVPQIRALVIVVGMACFGVAMSLFFKVGLLAFGGGDYQLEFSLFSLLSLETLLLVIHSLKSDSTIEKSKIWIFSGIIGVIAAGLLFAFLVSSPLAPSFLSFSGAVSIVAFAGLLAYSIGGLFQMLSD